MTRNPGRGSTPVLHDRMDVPVQVPEEYVEILEHLYLCSRHHRYEPRLGVAYELQHYVGHPRPGSDEVYPVITQAGRCPYVTVVHQHLPDESEGVVQVRLEVHRLPDRVDDLEWWDRHQVVPSLLDCS